MSKTFPCLMGDGSGDFFRHNKLNDISLSLYAKYLISFSDNRFA